MPIQELGIWRSSQALVSRLNSIQLFPNNWWFNRRQVFYPTSLSYKRRRKMCRDGANLAASKSAGAVSNVMSSSTEPGEGPLVHPATRQNLLAFCLVYSLDDLNHPRAIFSAAASAFCARNHHLEPLAPISVTSLRHKKLALRRPRNGC